MYLGIEIGGTKLQLAAGRGDGSQPAEIERLEVRPEEGAEGILRQALAAAGPLIQRYRLAAAGVGFGGPVEAPRGRTVKSHHVEGWEDFDLADWIQKRLGLPAALANDADTAALAEARFGAGRNADPVLYVTVGTGVGGGLIVGGALYRGHGLAAMEIGHLRPGIVAQAPEDTVESLASGWGIAAAAQGRLAEPVSHRFEPWLAGERPKSPEAVRQRLIEAEEAAEEGAADLLQRCDGRPEQITARHVVQAAAEGNPIAERILARATEALGWAIAQAVTLISPQKVVIGGGVSLAGEQLFFAPVRLAAERYVFPPLAETYEIVPAELGEEVVLHGALALARDAYPTD